MTNTFLPTPIPDESAFGLMTRAAMLMGYRTFSEFVNRIVPEVRIPSSGSAQGGVNLLIHWLVFGAGMPIESVLARFTNLAVYRPFVQNPLAFFETSDSWGGKSFGNGLSSWFLPLGSRLDCGSYCPQCAAEQTRDFGFTSWLRAHQIPDVEVCWKHGCNLFEVDLSVRSLTLPKVPAGKVNLDVKASDQQRHAFNMKELMEADLPWLSPGHRSAFYRKRLSQIEDGEVRIAGGIDSVMSLLEDTKIAKLLLQGSKLNVSDPGRNLELILGLFGTVAEFAKAFRHYGASKTGSSLPLVPTIEIVEEIRLSNGINKRKDAGKPLFLLKPDIKLYSSA